MKAIILVAGYASRLYPLTKDKPKALLEIAGKCVLERLLEKIFRVYLIDNIYIVTNQLFYHQFLSWVNIYPCPLPIKVICDGTETNETRLGAIADMQYVIEAAEIKDEIMVLAGDNLFDFELADFVVTFQEKCHDMITIHELNLPDKLRQTGVAQVDITGKLIAFEEKPQIPISNLAVPPFYIFRKETVPEIKNYLLEGNDPDAPGHLIPWLMRKKDVYTYKFSGNCFDIGTIEGYRDANRIFKF